MMARDICYLTLKANGISSIIEPASPTFRIGFPQLP